ncbi:MAG: hypothetical protein H7202_02600 [Pedobacter sp.]|nr:hypothetical protein [Pedobacter sp.]
MKTLLVTFFSFGFYLISFAQEKPVYFFGDKIISDPKLATFYGVFGKLSGSNTYGLNVYDIYNNLVKSGTYIDETLTIPHGKFSYYSFIDIFNDRYGTDFLIKKTDRFLSEQGKFINGNKNGMWLTFYPDGKVRSIINYKNGFKHGESKLLDKDGNTMIVGIYKLDVKDSLWNYYQEGRIETYVNGAFQHKKYN